MGVIDLGSNSLRLLIARIDAGEIITIRRELLETRLGEKLMPGGKLFPEAKKRTLDGLHDFFAIMREEKVEKGAVIATSAVREACDGGDFLEEVSKVSLFPVHLLTPREEAYFGFKGARRALQGEDSQEGNILVLDLGGRSSEVSWMNRDNFYYHSFAFGAVSLQEKFWNNISFTGTSTGNLQDYLCKKMEEEMGKSSHLREKNLVGLGGTITTLAALDLNLEHYQAEFVHGHLLRKKIIEKWEKRLTETSLEERKSLLPFAPQRADIIPAGTIALLSFMEYLQKDSLIVSEEGILWGALESL
jgi:exopolyphosphatase/guanosine-5'-triphosphate,3'-diphosphate pyrophosphatase